jgi:purine-binding chemotaxis protein CheW
MDFLKIRKKAKERAAAAAGRGARGGESTGPGPRQQAPTDAHAEPLPAGSQPPPDPVLTDEDVLEGALAARLQGLPDAEDGRFKTWRPGIGAPPALGPEPAPPPPDVRAESFTVVAGLGAAALAEPVAAQPRRESLNPLDDFFYRPDEEAPDVPEMGTAVVEGTDDEQGGVAREEYLTFLLGSEEYAVAIERVREVMKSPPITEVPRAPPHVIGVVTVRGEVVPVFDPRRRLGLSAAPPAEGSRVVIVDAGEGPCGLLVDAVASVVRLRPGGIEPCPHGLSAVSGDSVSGIGRDGERLFMVLDLGALLRRGAEPRHARDGRADADA